MLKKVASALKELKNQMVFVGGAVISLYTDDSAADEIRPTQDIDMTINLHGFGAWAKMQERLAELGFHSNPKGMRFVGIISNNIKDLRKLNLIIGRLEALNITENDPLKLIIADAKNYIANYDNTNN